MAKELTENLKSRKIKKSPSKCRTERNDKPPPPPPPEKILQYLEMEKGGLPEKVKET